MEKSRHSEEKNLKEQVSREELDAHGIPENISMTRGELQRHLQTKKLQDAADTDPTASLRREMSRQLTPEEITRAEQAGKKREEMGR